MSCNAYNSLMKEILLSMFYRQETWVNREAKELEQGHTGGRQQSWDSTPLLPSRKGHLGIEDVLQASVLFWSY